MTVDKPKRHRGIFGTPEEPIFNCPPCQDFPRILQETLISMATENACAVQQATVNQGLFGQGVAANFVFAACEKLRLPYQVKFTALELFDRFMQSHIVDLYRHVYTSSSSEDQKRSDWRNILERVQKQLYLRIVSCCQIASKLSSHYKVVSVSRAKLVLLELGHNYTAGSVLQSELRVLKTLNFRVATLSALDYVETILQVLAHNSKCVELPVWVYHKVSVRLLTLLFLRQEQVCRKLLLHGDASTPLSAQARQGLAQMQADKLSMAAAVVATAAFISDQSQTDVVIEHVHRITQMASEDIEDFVTTLVQEVQDYPSP